MPTIHQFESFKTGIGATVTGLLMVAASVAAWFCWQENYWVARSGPTEVPVEQIAKLESPRQLPSPWVKVKFDQIVDSGVEMQEARIGDNVTEYKFMLCQAGDRWMIATVPEGFRGNELSGQIYHSANPQDIEAFVAIHQERKEIHGGRLFPFEFRAEIDFGDNWSYFPYVIGGLGLAGLFIGGLGVYLIGQGFQEPGAPYVVGPSAYDPLANEPDTWERHEQEVDA